MNQAILAIQSEASSLVTVNVLSAIESADWAAVAKLSERLSELAARGMYHDSLAKRRDINAFAMGNHSERDAR